MLISCANPNCKLQYSDSLSRCPGCLTPKRELTALEQAQSRSEQREHGFGPGKRIAVLALIVSLLATLIYHFSGPVKIAEFMTRDGKIQVTIFDPIECDEDKRSYAVVKGLSVGGEQFGLDWQSCGNAFDPAEYVWLEENGWCAIASSSALKRAKSASRETIYGVIDRNKSFIYIQGHNLNDCPGETWEVVALALEARKKALRATSQ